MQSFNKALLAKQGWKLTHQPNCMLEEYFKAIYYPNGSYLESREGKNVSNISISLLLKKKQ